jgi:hypothetical protein
MRSGPRPSLAVLQSPGGARRGPLRYGRAQQRDARRDVRLASAGRVGRMIDELKTQAAGRRKLRQLQEAQMGSILMPFTSFPSLPSVQVPGDHQ